MKFEKVLSEAGFNVKDPDKARETTKKSVERMDASNKVIAEFALEVHKTGGAIHVNVKCLKSDDSKLEGKTWSDTTAPKFVSALKQTLTSRLGSYKIDEASFKNFLNELIKEANQNKTRNRAMAHTSTSPTKSNPNPKWDASFRLYRKSGTGNELAFVKTTESGKVVWSKSGEKEKSESPLKRFAQSIGDQATA